MKIIMIPTTNELYEIPNYEKYELPNKVVDYIKQLEEENKNNYFIHMKEWAKAIGNNAKLQQRIDKTIEYIENHFLYHYGSETKPVVFEDNYIQEIVDILRGKDNE